MQGKLDPSFPVFYEQQQFASARKNRFKDNQMMITSLRKHRLSLKVVVLVWSGAAVLGLAGCASMPAFSRAAVLQLDIAAPPVSSQIAVPKIPFVLRWSEYIDARPDAASQKIGDINATIFDMMGTDLVIQDLPRTVTGALVNQLTASGFQMIAEEPKATVVSADFEVYGTIREFSMNIGGRDEVAIAIETSLRDARRGDILWSGTVIEKADRYAGIAGNTRVSITRYLSAALAKVCVQTQDAISTSIARAYPERFEPTARTRSTATSRLVVATIPERAKVYVGDVYYGLSPLNLGLEPGIYTINIKRDGFQSVTQKLSVRTDEVTQLEIRLLEK